MKHLKIPSLIVLLITLSFTVKQVDCLPFTYLFNTKLDHSTAPGADNTPTFNIRYIVDD